MVPVIATHNHILEDMSATAQVLCDTADSLSSELKVLLEHSPPANDFMAVDEFFHQLRDIQYRIGRVHAQLKALVPKFHIVALETVSDSIYKKVKNSTTFTNKLCEAFAPKVTEYALTLEQDWKQCESTSIQYNTLMSALKKGL